MDEQSTLRVGDRYQYAGFWSRVGAAVIDTVILCVLTYPILVAVYGWAYFDSDAVIQGGTDFVLTLPKVTAPEQVSALVTVLEGLEAAEFFLRFGNGDRDFTQSISPHDDLARLCKGARMVEKGVLKILFIFASHFSCLI